MTTGRINQVTIRVHVDRTAPLRTGQTPAPKADGPGSPKDVTARALLQSLAHRSPTEWLRRAVAGRCHSGRVDRSTGRRRNTNFTSRSFAKRVQPKKSLTARAPRIRLQVGPDADPNAVPAQQAGQCQAGTIHEATAPGTPAQKAQQEGVSFELPCLLGCPDKLNRCTPSRDCPTCTVHNPIIILIQLKVTTLDTGTATDAASYAH